MIEQLAELLSQKRFLALTGAGISTESGIPDYRGPVTRAKARNPIQHREFLEKPEARARYWARSVLGWPRFEAFTPNAGHWALRHLEEQNRCCGILTQNVDRLHHRAGSEQAIELHGTLHQVRCLACGGTEARGRLQQRLLELNPEAGGWPYQLAPDGDADIPVEAVEAFEVPSCLDCGGVLKPDVVFFGDNVPAPRVAAAFEALEQAQALQIVGSSLAVWSGYRFAVRAAERNIPIAIVNLGQTRADELAAVRLEGKSGEVLPELMRRLR